MSDRDPGQRPVVAAQPEEATRLSQSLSNKEFIATYQALDSIQKKLKHEEFHFVRYLLKMVLLELDSHSKQGDEEAEGDDGEESDPGGVRLADAS